MQGSSVIIFQTGKKKYSLCFWEAMDTNWNTFFLCLSRISCNFTVSVFEQFAQIAHELSVLGDTENRTGQGPGQPLWFNPALSRNGGLELQRSFLTTVFLWLSGRPQLGKIRDFSLGRGQNYPDLRQLPSIFGSSISVFLKNILNPSLKSGVSNRMMPSLHFFILQ